MFGFGKSGTDAIALLKADHRSFENLFRAFDKARTRERKLELAGRLCHDLAMHAQLKEDLLYPNALAAFDKRDHGLIWEATVEQGTLSGLIATLADHAARSDQFEPHVQVLHEYVKHRIHEEEGEIFPRLRASRVDLQDLGAQIAQRKSELLATTVPSETPAPMMLPRTAAA